MKRLLGFLIGIALSGVLVAQQVQTIDAKIVDESNGQILPYATIYIGPNHGTISNQEGEFTITALPTDFLHISYVGYESITIQASNVPATIKLSPYSIELSEVIVKPVDLHKLVQQIFNQQKEQIEKHMQQESSFFYRQTTQTNSEYNEIMETFFNAKSVICLRDLDIVAGRYAKLSDDSITKYITFTDFFQYSGLTPIRIKKLKKKEVVVPLMNDFYKYYTLSYDVLSSKNNIIYKIIFTPKKVENKFILGGILYVDSSTLDLIRVESNSIYPIVIRNDGKVTDNKPANLKIVLNYRLIEHASIVETVNVHCEIKTDTMVYKMNSILYNVGDKIKSKKGKSPKSNMLVAVENMNYDPDFWKDKSVIKRTPLEKTAIEMFEKKNLFGTYSLDK